MQKREEIANPNSRLNKAADDEPVFVLRASDKFAAPLVRLWADLAELVAADPAKVHEARQLARQMDEWPRAKFPD